MTLLEKTALSMARDGVPSEQIEKELDHEFIFFIDTKGEYKSASLWR